MSPIPPTPPGTPAILSPWNGPLALFALAAVLYAAWTMIIDAARH